ncbi:hypothetical protein FACS189413_10320 [Bacteroidia bacterium]|nr:hypothetical protein FACS189413_10320 [Bacteroidia bacterium]
MKDEINQLKEAFRNAKSDKEVNAIDLKMKELMAKNPGKWAQSMVDVAKETAEAASQLAVKEKLKEVIPALSMVYIAKNYFKKTDAWLYQRINGNIVNGKPAEFTDTEIETFKYALHDLSRKLGSISVNL